MSWRTVIAAFLLLAALVGHWAYSYRPRERSGIPRSNQIAGALFLEGELPYRRWLPCPHPSRGVLEGAREEPDGLLDAVGELSGRQVPRLPAFGSVRLPPSSEIAIASNASGDTFVAVARVYPLVGLLARWAGRLAGNPLLAGGEAEFDGRPVTVMWRHGSWIVIAGGARVPEVSRQVAESPTGSALGWALLERRRGYLPAGSYRLQRVGRALELTSGSSEDLASLAASVEISALAPLLVADSGAKEGAGLRAMALLDGIHSLGGLPGAVTFQSGERRWRLPGESLLRLVGDGPPRSEVAGWRLVALEQESLDRGVEMVPQLGRIRDSALGAGAWVRLSSAESLVDQVVGALEAVPVIGRQQARRWRALSTVLAPLVPMEQLTALVGRRGSVVYVRLGRPGEAGPD